MSDDLGVIIEGDRALQLKFDQFPQALHLRLLDTITTETEELASRIRAAVPRRTGRLAGEITSSVRDSEDRIVGRVSVSAEFAKAAALEYGGTGKPFKVRAHTAKLAHLWGRAVGTPMLVDVSEHTRSLHTPARRFMRGPLEAMRGEVEAALREAVTQTEAE